MNRTKKLILLINFILVITLINVMMYQSEQTIKNGKLVFFEIVPIDPRSIIQGDYMTLNYNISSQGDKKMPSSGVAYIGINKEQIVVEINQDSTLLDKSLRVLPIQYTKVGSRLRFGIESYLFQEGKAKSFEKAKYSGVRINATGNCILVGLYKSDLEEIKND